jgi:hypothetical protein
VPSVLSLPMSPGLKDDDRREVGLVIQKSGDEVVR